LLNRVLEDILLNMSVVRKII